MGRRQTFSAGLRTFTWRIQMADTDAEAIELTREEAREVINALTNFQFEVSGREEERALNVRQFLKREFDFEEEHFDDQRGLADLWENVFDPDYDDEHEIQLVEPEAAEVVAALAEAEGDAKPGEAETIADIRGRFEETFDLDAT